MIKVALEGVEIFAYHGFYPEEQKTGTKFLIDVHVSFEQNGSFKDDTLNHTVNYEELYTIIKEEMANTRKVIETVAEAILDRVKATFSFIDAAEVVIKKQNPPFSGPIKQSVISLSYQK
ncbi:dihydroneopterin aldolase [Mucilaginibacter sp. MD40]|uniref:dihydroneopterin aldolase n=1 Tax=Mucilaginibacter sp. MD40 TaxID=2029590 RepID=UPI000BAC98C2|nr:dihydroneopterin aldolase [Mucilaginibacter sp. MD40]PAW94527.1 dihydroneopterin aldolase [Mucilaginibacter sp. MD40]